MSAERENILYAELSMYAIVSHLKMLMLHPVIHSKQT